jgi:hypothetical protein
MRRSKVVLVLPFLAAFAAPSNADAALERCGGVFLQFKPKAPMNSTMSFPRSFLRSSSDQI